MSSLSTDYWPLGTLGCKLYKSGFSLLEFTRAFVLALLGLFCYAMHRGKIYELDNAKVTLLLTSCWIVGILTTLPVYMSSDIEKGQCNIFWPENAYASDAYVLIFAICVFFAPLMVGLLVHHKRNLTPFPGEDISVITKTMNLVFVLVGAHIVLLFPFLIGQFALNYYKTAPGILPEWKVNTGLVTGLIWTSVVAVFPVLYTYTCDDIREGLQNSIDVMTNMKLNYTNSFNSTNVKPAPQPMRNV
ncbi:hypothetical protein HDE_02029 [Halotydeus destructor]|nr:hypothetical protein HDE_02029 [Halotydeus destructor]